jgi:hypothetical protein
VNTVLGSRTGPRGGGSGVITVPDTGQGGDEGGATGWIIASAMLIAMGAGLIGTSLVRKRRN